MAATLDLLHTLHTTLHTSCHLHHASTLVDMPPSASRTPPGFRNCIMGLIICSSTSTSHTVSSNQNASRAPSAVAQAI
jgi:hypothetical protein